MSTCVFDEWQAVIGSTHHVPDPQDDGACADMAAQTAACGVPAVPRGDHRVVRFTAAARAFSGDVRVEETDPAPSAEFRFSARRMTNRIRLIMTRRLLINVSGLTERRASR